MDAITHGLVGGLIARLGPTEKLGGSATAVGVAAAVLPDIDYALFVAGPGAYYCHHRETTHSLLGGIAMATIVAVLANAATGRKAFAAFWGVAVAGFLSHLVLDVLTPFGTLAFFPFSDRRLAGDVLGLLDPWLSLIVFAATAIGFSPRHRARAALFGLALVVGYVGGLVGVRQLAVARTREEAKGIQGVRRIEVLPVPMLPFAWHGIVDAKGSYYVFEVRGGDTRLVRIVSKAVETRWVEKVRQDPVAAPFFKAARFPVIQDAVDEGGHHITVHDLGLELAAGRPLFLLKADITPAPVGSPANEEQVGIQVILREAAEQAK
ncbi:MAG: metal-dependent hydrolase [Planctomycetes bacterium]|nr:metal-dependent hydrolase [Planctomycetota bacterium]